MSRCLNPLYPYLSTWKRWPKKPVVLTNSITRMKRLESLFLDIFLGIYRGEEVEVQQMKFYCYYMA